MAAPQEFTNAQVLAREINWSNYAKGQLITQEEHDQFMHYEKKERVVQQDVIMSQGEELAFVLISMLTKVKKEDAVHYLIVLIDDLLEADPANAEVFHAAIDENATVDVLDRKAGTTKQIASAKFAVGLLTREEWHIQKAACSVLCKLLTSESAPECAATESMRKDLCEWSSIQLRTLESTGRVTTLLDSLKCMLKFDYCRAVFRKMHGLEILTSERFKLLDPRIKDVDAQYKGIFCLWLMSYNEQVREEMGCLRAIKPLVAILRVSNKTRVVRVCLMTLRNLSGFGRANQVMIDIGTIRVLQALLAKKWPDEDLTEDVEFLVAALEKDVTELSSWATYSQEVKSGALEWTPCHKEETFWRKNVMRFEEEDSTVVKELVALVDYHLTHLAEESYVVICVACNDLGELARVHPRGGKMLTDMGGKTAVLKAMEVKDDDVRREALLAIQKIMVASV